MSHKEQFSREDIPDELRQQFAVVLRRLWRVETTMAVCLAAAGLFGSYLVLFFSDCLWDSPGWLRLGLLSAGVGVAVASVVWWLSRWVFHKRDTRALAKLVQRRYRRLGDRLLGIVELADVEDLYSDPRHPYTKALLSAVPRPDPIGREQRERIVLSGDVPSPSDPPSGCPFEPRCPHPNKDERCTRVYPIAEGSSDGHLVACHHADS